MHIRSYDHDDYDAVSALWATSEHLGPVPRDDVESKLRRDPELFLVAVDDDGDEPVVVGVVMGSTDGRRGWINRLAVDPARRHEGIGAAIVEELERRMLATGTKKVNLLVFGENTGGRAFWERLGYPGFEGLVLHSKRLDRDDDRDEDREEAGPAC